MSGLSRTLSLITPFVLALGLYGCGGGGDDSNNNGSTPTTSTINGVAMAGPISGQVCAFPVSETGVPGTTSLGCANTNPTTGAYTLTISDYLGTLMLSVTGTYTDEATGQTITLTSDNPLRTVTRLETSGGTVSAAITPMTEVAVRAALATGGLTEGPVLNAFANLATALGLNATGGDAAYASLVEVLPALTGDNTGARTYGALLDLLSTAQAQYCAGSTTCGLFDYVNQVVTYLGSVAGTLQLEQSLQQAFTAWQTTQANAPYICTYSLGAFSCAPNSNGGGNGGGNGSGNYNLDLLVTAMGTTTPIHIGSVPKPTTQDEFCGSALEMASAQANVPGATWTMNSCSFDGMHGVITATVSITSPISMTIPYSVDYTYSAL